MATTVALLTGTGKGPWVPGFGMKKPVVHVRGKKGNLTVLSKKTFNSPTEVQLCVDYTSYSNTSLDLAPAALFAVDVESEDNAVCWISDAV